jgi:hypothetical protein
MRFGPQSPLVYHDARRPGCPPRSSLAARGSQIREHPRKLPTPTAALSGRGRTPADRAIWASAPALGGLTGHNWLVYWLRGCFYPFLVPLFCYVYLTVSSILLVKYWSHPENR